MTSNRLLTVAVAAALLCALAPAVQGAFCHGKPDPNAKPNSNPIYTGSPVAVRSTTNGKAYRAGPTGYEFWVVHVYGTAYEMGYAHGSMMKAEASEMVSRTWAYFESQVEDALNGIPNWLKSDIADFGLDVALDLTIELTKNYTGEYFFDEIRGLADGAGVDYQTVLRIHMIGELTKGDCSMYGAWGAATATTGKTMQLRALDWDIDGPFKDYPAVVVYHPSGTDLGHPFANVGFIGWVGALTGMSSAQLGISEIGVAFPDSTFGKESREGVPFTFLLRDILQFDKTYEDSISRIQNAHRTCDLILGVGDGKAKTFRGFEYSYSVADVISDTNLRPVNETWHPQIKDIVYWGMDWLCPGYNEALAKQLKAFYGNITAENTINNILPVVQTGNVHIGVYDLTDQLLYVSFAAPTNGTGPTNSYDRLFTRLELDSLFSESGPSAPSSVMQMA